jgi:hypothetical protein
MSFGYAILLLFGGYAVLRFIETQNQVKVSNQNRAGNPPGVSYFKPIAAPNTRAQSLASQQRNSCAVTQPGYAPAFGPRENMPRKQLITPGV